MKSVLFKHRSIRKFLPTPIPEEVLQECLEAASRASTCGNMQLYSLVVTRDRALREQFAPCHFNQPMVCEAPCVVTVCADVHRFTMWCEQRDAEPAYDNFAWFLNASTDALLAAQNLCIEAEMHGLGICYLGTTIYTAGDISRILELPKGVIPLTTVVMGYPDEAPELTDRLPLEAVVHYEKYTDYTAAGGERPAESGENIHRAPLCAQGQPGHFEILFRPAERKGFLQQLTPCIGCAAYSPPRRWAFSARPAVSRATSPRDSTSYSR